MFVHSMELNALIKWLFGFHFYLLLFGWMKYTRVVLFQAQEIWPTSPWKDMCHLPMSWKSLENGLCWDSFSLWEFSPLPWLYWIYTHRSNISLKHYIPESVFQKKLGRNWVKWAFDGGVSGKMALGWVATLTYLKPSPWLWERVIWWLRWWFRHLSSKGKRRQVSYLPSVDSGTCHIKQQPWAGGNVMTLGHTGGILLQI